MGVTKYTARSKTWWRVDEWVTRPDGTLARYRKKRIPTREQAMALAAKVMADAFEGRFFDRARPCTVTVKEAWESYSKKSERENDSWQTDKGRSVHLLRHLGSRRVASLTIADVDAYRTHRSGEITRMKGHPKPGPLDREVELLKRTLNYAVACKELVVNPLARVPLLKQPNVRDVVLDEEGFSRLYEAADAALRPFLLLAIDTGMRKGEILGLKWEQVNLTEGVIRLRPQETKANDARIVPLTARVLAMLKELPQGLPHLPLLLNPRTKAGWKDIRRMFNRARTKAGLGELHIHDLRRSFVTLARRNGIPESVVMRMSGHKTSEVFRRYNIVEMRDLREAVAVLDKSWSRFGHSLPKEASTPEGSTA